jgi:5-formyltetrahydrofolate cyclo-ligase
MGAVRDAKRAMRAAVRAAVIGLDPALRSQEERAVLDQVDRLPGFVQAGTLLLYVSALPDEIPTMGLIAAALDRGQVVVLPRVDRGARRLSLHRIDDPTRDLVAGVFGIPEPAERIPEIDPGAIDWALVPGVAFDVMGYRLGRGAGYYDRLLPLLRPETPRWSLALRLMWVDAVPREPHDQPIDGILGADRRFERTITGPVRTP